MNPSPNPDPYENTRKLSNSKVCPRWGKEQHGLAQYEFLRDIAISSYYRAVDIEIKTSVYDIQERKRKSVVITPSERPDRNEIILQSSKFSRM